MEHASEGGHHDEDHGAGLFGGPGRAQAHLDGPDQGPLFQIEGPDEDGCVWICSKIDAGDQWCQNLGPFESAAQAMIEWLERNDYGE